MLIPFSELVQEFQLKVKGVIHVGAHECQELQAYNQIGIPIDKILWYEAQETIRQKVLKTNSKIRIHQAIVSDVDGAKVSFMVTNNGESSSILEFGKHKEYHPHVVEQSRFEGITKTLDTIFKDNKEDLTQYNFLNMDIQGAELLALKGATNLLNHIDYMYLEVNDQELYKGCALITDIDIYVAKFGFKRVKTKMTEYHWGDALYMKTSLISQNQSVKSLINTTAIAATSGLPIVNNSIYSIYGFRGKSLPTQIFSQDGNHSTNGELWFWNLIKDKVNLLFDIGVKNNIVYPEHKGLTQHCFEPNTQYYNNNIKNKANNNIIINRLALGNNKTLIDYYSHSESINRKAYHNCNTNCGCKYQINMTTVDQYCSDNKISQIDFLKINTEGYELEILKGATKILHSTSFIQFAYSAWYPDNHIMLADVYTFLHANGFKFIYLLQSDHMTKCDKPIENGKYCNYIACQVQPHTLLTPKIKQSLITQPLLKKPERKDIGNIKHTMVTACDTAYFECCKTQIASVHRTSNVDEYLVYDLGLSAQQIQELNTFNKVKVCQLPDGVGDVNNYTWKIAIFNHLRNSEGLFFYLDSGAMLLEDVGQIFYLIDKHDMFLCGDDTQFNYAWCHPQFVEIIKATDKELDGFQICAGITGWKGKGKYTHVIEDAYKYSQIKECIDGLKFHNYGYYKGKAIRGHRHDQSILSILKERYLLQTWPVHKYGQWQSYKYAVDNKAVIYVHRKSHQDFNGLIIKSK